MRTSRAYRSTTYGVGKQRSPSSPVRLGAVGIVSALQRSVGNQAVLGLLANREARITGPGVPAAAATPVQRSVQTPNGLYGPQQLAATGGLGLGRMLQRMWNAVGLSGQPQPNDVRLFMRLIADPNQTYQLTAQGWRPPPVAPLITTGAVMGTAVGRGPNLAPPGYVGGAGGLFFGVDPPQNDPTG